MKVKEKTFEFPVSAIAKNFILTNTNEVWAGYQISHQVYPLNDLEFFTEYLQDGEGVLGNDNYEYHICNIPKKFPLDQHVEKTIEKIVQGNNADIGEYYFNEAKEILDEEVQQDQYDTFLFIRFSTIRDVYNPMEYIELFKEVGERKLNELLGTNYQPNKILRSYVREEKQVYSDLLNFKQVRRINEQKIGRLFYYFYHRANPKPVTRKLNSYELNEGIVTPHKGYIEIEQLERTHYSTTYCLIGMPASMEGGAFVQNLQDSLSFPIETHSRIRFSHRKKDIKDTHKMRKRIFEQDNEQQDATGILDDDEVILFGEERLRDLNNRLKSREKRLCNVTIMFVISGKSKKEMEQRASDLEFILEDGDYKVYRPIADQMVLFNQCLIGSPYTFHAFEQKTTTGYLMDFGFDLDKEVGNHVGLPLGRVITAKKYRDVRQALEFSSKLVWFFPSLAKKAIKGALHTNGNTLITGPQGQGKSVLVKYLFLWLTFLGQKILYVDPKNETEMFFKKAIDKYGMNDEFKQLYERINFVSLSQSERNRGMLDPLMFLPKEEGITLAKTILETFGEVNVNPQTMATKKAVISDAIVTVLKGRGKKHLTKVIEEIRKQDEELAKLISGYQNGLGKILIGNDLSQPLSFDTQINVLGLQGLNLPSKKAEASGRMNNEQIASVMIMEAVMKLTYVFSTDKSEDAAIIFDEAKGFEDTAQGEYLIDDSLRKGRANNTDIYILTQTFSDYDTPAKKELISYKFAFRPRQKKEQEKVLEFYGMDINKANLEMIQSLVPGTCLFQDHLGRNQPIAIDVLFDSWMLAISSTSKQDKATMDALEMEEEFDYV
ncbi:ATP-binding protein [Enterococcus sp. DIV0660C]|uniref:ATP-binding protein n=1 Tax=Enterococcus sp. DIV0660C TaxID=2230880 RepID=UPI001A8CD765|nr:ATP-binding protein [Enterococcus sp. DIV0660C]